MGSQSSKLQYDVKPEELFKTKDDVTKRLINQLHIHLCQNPNNKVSERLDAIFNQRASSPAESHEKEWTLKTFTSYLADQNPELEDFVKDASPILYQIAVHLGSYPFQPSGVALTYEKFLIFLAVFSSVQEIFFFTYEPRASGPGYRTVSKPRDHIRLLFQSLQTSEAHILHDSLQRRTADDEDLIDVLCLTQLDDSNGKLMGLTRDELAPIASKLPSSGSADLDGRVELQYMRLLFRVLVPVVLQESNIRPPEGVSWSDFTKGVVESLVALFVGEGQEVDEINWQAFSTAFTESAPYFFEYFQGFIEDTFTISTEKSIKPWPLGSSEAISAPQISLFKFWFGPSGANYATLLHSWPAEEKTLTDFQSSLMSLPLLLLIKGATEGLGQPVVMVALIGHVYQGEDEIWTIMRPGQMFFSIKLLILSPYFKMLDEGQTNIEFCNAATSEGGFSIKFEQSKLVVSANFDHVLFSANGRDVSILTEFVESWTVGE